MPRKWQKTLTLDDGLSLPCATGKRSPTSLFPLHLSSEPRWRLGKHGLSQTGEFLNLFLPCFCTLGVGESPTGFFCFHRFLRGVLTEFFLLNFPFLYPAVKRSFFPEAFFAKYSLFGFAETFTYRHVLLFRHLNMSYNLLRTLPRSGFNGLVSLFELVFSFLACDEGMYAILFLKKGFPRDDRPELQRPPRGRREGLQGPPVAGHSKGEAIIDSPYHNNSILDLFCV